MSRRIVVIVVAVVAVLGMCACVALVGLGGLGFWGYQSVARNLIPTVGIVVTPVPTSTGERDLLTEMADIEAQVSAIRELEMDSSALARTLQTSDELRESIMAQFEEEYSPEEAADDARVFALFEMLPPDFDLYNLYIDLYSAGIAGYYEPDDDAIYVISDQPHLDASTRNTYAHEYVHALQDYFWDIRALGFSEEGWEEDSQRAAAIQALIEGEASFVESIWRENYFTQADYNEFLWVSLEQLGNETLAEMPQWLFDDLYFPYGRGQQFVQAVYDRGGWAAVDAVYADPPVSVEMILHPQKYFDRELPIEVAAVDAAEALGTGWREIDEGVMGEWTTQLILGEFGEADYARAAAGWGGDRYSIAYDDASGDYGMVWHTVWDSVREAEEYAAAFREYGLARFGSDPVTQGEQMCWAGTTTGLHCLLQVDDATLWVVAPDSAALELLVVAVGGAFE